MRNRFQKWTAFLLLFCFALCLGAAVEEKRNGHEISIEKTHPDPPLCSLCPLWLIDFLSENKEEKKEGQPVAITKLIPGLFQLESKKTVKGLLLFGAFTACVVGAVVENNRGNDLYRQYLISTNVEEIVALRQKTEKKFKNRNLYIAGALGVWLIHLLDLKLFKNKKGGIKGEITKQKINIGVYYSF